ncbi:V-type proton ATPase subunit C 1-A [Takifugu flavidus]|uniref:V-type proton ATPase subunit C n=1 Tax=Takifugu flavidus TaxID=433684 RepID=A0A5C6P0R5_9TELE|nr:V-type proton ATPase subunit C 1-A [Takifugu flavidus]
MADLWLISVPLDKPSITSVEKLKHTIAKTNLASYFMFPIPDLKEGILDSLLCLSDDLSNMDILTESVIRSTCQCLRDVTEGSSDKVVENALVNGVDLLRYVTRFQWDKAKYPTTMPLSCLKDLINKSGGADHTQWVCEELQAGIVQALHNMALHKMHSIGLVG